MKTYSFSDFKKILKIKNQELIPEKTNPNLKEHDRILSTRKFWLRCLNPDCNSEMERSFKSLLYSSTTGCPHCNHSVLKKNGPELFKSSVEALGGKVVSDLSLYKNVNSKLWVQCEFGHKPFKTSSHMVRNIGRWCKHCARHISERFTIAYCEGLTGKEFLPYELQKATGKGNKGQRLIDGFNAETEVGIEYDGRLHNKKEQKKRDKEKDQLFKQKHQNGVLIRIPDPRTSHKFEKIKKMIKIELLKIKDIIPIVNNDPQIDLSVIYSKKLLKLQKDLEEEIKSRGLTLMSPYMGSKNIVKVRHTCGATFSRTPEKLKRKNSGCDYCRKNNILEKKRSTFQNILKNYDFTMIRYYTQKRTGKVMVTLGCNKCGRVYRFRQNKDHIQGIKPCSCCSNSSSTLQK